MMKKIFSLLFIANAIFSQTSNDSLNSYEQKVNFNTLFNPTIFLERNFNSNLNLDFLQRDSSLLFYKLNFISKQINEEQIFYNSADQILNPLYQNFLEKQKYKPVFQLLGTIQFGAVAYLAYLHFKKYSFPKKK